ncbi:MAG: PSD1 and planctomycete cytochrome C domain-containing protein [Opitutaceae bacterium]
MALLLVGPRGFRQGTGLAVVASLAATVWAAPAAPVAPLSFNRDIRPILSENCFQCHGPDKNHRKADLRLDVREDALEALAWVPGDVGRSDAVRRIFSDDPDEQMPPKDSHRTLSAKQKDTLQRWVAEGAAYQPHWAYVAPVRPEVPAAPTPTASSHPIDRFITATLAREQLPAAPEADRRTLLRRLSLDLTGLPPRPADVEAFVASQDPKAYETWVDAYLGSPHYGERMAIPWLDLVRFADTVGFHNDVPLRVWPYRDYVINAFNRNLPFDQFTREQLAGDLLPGSTPEQRVGSGYNRIHRMSVEGGIQDKEYFAKYAADRVRTTATVWMGSTLACAECHDHKFDPFTLKDFYRFAAIFSDLKERGAYNLTGGFTRENLTEETLFQTPEQKQRVEALTAEIAALTKQIESPSDESLAAGLAAWEEKTLALHRSGTLAWSVQKPIAATSTVGTPLTVEDEDQSIVPGGVNPVSDTYLVTVPVPFASITAVRLESITDARFPGDEVSRSGSAFYISEIEVSGLAHAGARPVRLRLADCQTNGSIEPGFPASAAIDGDPATAASFYRSRGGGLALTLAQPFSGGPDARLILRIRHLAAKPYQNLGRFRIALHTLPEPDPNPDGVPSRVLAALQLPVAERKPNHVRDLAAHYRSIAPELAPARTRLLAARVERDSIVESLPSMPVSKSVEPRPMRVLPRGNWMDDSGDLVEPGVPGFLRQITPADGKRVSRLDFAEWLVAPDNPLTARTFVNRLWRLYFGEGLTRTLEDLGSQGEWPTHPELLDWLAVEFRESGWNVKHLVRLIVTSEAYRRSSRGTPVLDERDPQNRFLARQNRFRLEAELVRDNALAISGLLSPRVGGPSAHPYQPESYYAPLNFPRREYVPDTGEGLHRRGVYTHWQRTLLHPSLMAFDAPSRDECTVNRSTSNTPLQALVLLNDPTYVEAARTLAERILRGGGWSFPSRLTWAFERAVARPPAQDEVRLLRRLYDQQRARYQADPAAARALLRTGASPFADDLAPAELAAWTAVARALLNLHETVTRS